MHTIQLVYFSVTTNEIPNLSLAIHKFREQVGPMSVFARSRTQLEDNESLQQQFITKALDADIVIITLMSGRRSFPAWDAFIKKLELKRKNGEKTPYFHVQPTGSNARSMEMVEAFSNGVDTQNWHNLSRYYRYGGVDNLLQMLISLYNVSFQKQLVVKPPVRPPHEGIYHPDLDHIPELTDYSNGFDSGKPTIGIWFYQNFWVTDNKAHIDALIREVEKQGANVLCVFHTRFRDKLIKSHGADYVVEHYFMDNGRPVIDALINPVMFSLGMVAPEYKHLLEDLNVPVIQALCTGRTIAQWEESDQGLNNVDITISVAQPELDGVIIGVPVASKQFSGVDPITGSAINRYVPIPERVEKLVNLTLNWARLGHKINAEKKIAIIFHHHPPRNDRIGCASGLDSFESISQLLMEMEKQGYKLEKKHVSGDDLARELINGMTCDQRWLLPEQMAQRAVATASSVQYLPWHESLPGEMKEKMVRDWGAMPGKLFVHENKLMFPGIINGNVFLTIQPPRGYFEDIDKLYHDPHLSCPHHYLAHYRWIKEVFKADAVLHVGKHGSLEWLPGKAVGLSENCYPDRAIMDLPNAYVYIINDPGEGTQAKRRSAACIVDHLPPALTHADIYDDLIDVENLVKEYREARVQDQGKLEILCSMVWEAVAAADLDKDLGIDHTRAMEDFPGFMEKLHEYLTEIGDTAITRGLHILGQSPMGRNLVETLAQMTRLANGNIPSLRSAIVSALGYDMETVTRRRGSVVDRKQNLTGGQIIGNAHALALDLLGDVVELSSHLIAEKFHGRDNDGDAGIQAGKLNMGDTKDEPGEAMVPGSGINEIITRHMGQMDGDIEAVLQYVHTTLLPRLMETRREITSCLDSFDGKFVPPGPSGAPSRGQADILPTGRNFFSVDPQKIPTPAAWEVGKRLGDALILKYMEEHGSWPDNVGVILWASPTMRSKGDDIAEILYLMGVKPVWQAGSGNVRGVEVIPLSELGRPRIDVTPRISGIFRDAFPLLIDLIDKGVQMVARLKEPHESNFIRGHVTMDMETLVKKGMDTEAAFRDATFRIFGAAPGSYGSGVSTLVESKQWQTREDLGDMYIKWSSHAYGQSTYGQPHTTGFKRALGRMSATVKNEDTREKDMMLCTDYYSYHGGLISAVQSVKNERPFSMAGDSADPGHVKVRTTAEEARHIFRSRLLNPKWIEGLKAHGYKGAGDLSKTMDIIFGWDATANVIDDFMYRRFADKVPLDREIQEWMKQVNPYALQNILDKLLEAAARGMWQPDDGMMAKMQEAFLDAEGDIEELVE
ncbi:cobaltochelatase CobN subunit [Desulfocicer vacuolatum DSM 3385]|uniref:Cobaltochelatase CobN subunit n=1 Tax=Desulfocicer vacuolatum DSM 3385 TaxID=1121400 RepID=A0A1W2E5G3_9BACT|nr:cobaltochelatase subunit CobN [Desulfocicer vacuolatum]SMD05071.1 cobaltochelatase CobN subunit [Desulfocicer vacuolatum DSM 3385]